MSSFNFELDNMTFSYSSVNLFHTCPYAFKLTYIDTEDKVQNFFAEYGTLMHHVIESYWRGNIEKDELVMAFNDAYNIFVVTPPPPFPDGMEERYYNDAIKFLQEFPYEREEYSVIIIEGKFDLEYKGIKITVRPDLILREKSTNQVILLDFKTSKPVKGKKWDEAKMADYKRQTLLYAHFFQQATGITVNKITLLFVRLQKEYDVEITETSIAEVLTWLENTIQVIKWEEDFEPHIDNYFCANLCGVRNACKFWREVVFKQEFDPNQE